MRLPGQGPAGCRANTATCSRTITSRGIRRLPGVGLLGRHACLAGTARPDILRPKRSGLPQAPTRRPSCPCSREAFSGPPCPASLPCLGPGLSPARAPSEPTPPLPAPAAKVLPPLRASIFCNDFKMWRNSHSHLAQKEQLPPDSSAILPRYAFLVGRVSVRCCGSCFRIRKSPVPLGWRRLSDTGSLGDKHT